MRRLAAALILLAANPVAGCVGFAEVTTFEMRSPPPPEQAAPAGAENEEVRRRSKR